MKAIIKNILLNLPGSFGMKIRKKYYKKKFYQSSNCFYIFPNVTINFPENVSIGKKSRINTGTWISAMGEVIIGNDVLIGPFVIIHSANHRFERVDIPIRQQGWNKSFVIIEDDVWIGANAIILPGVTIGKGSVIGAGTIVTRDIPSYSVAVGVPAKIIKKRSHEQDKLIHDHIVKE